MPREAPLPEAAPPHRRRPRTFGTVALGGLALGAVIVAVTFALYERFIHYERVAALHVPDDAILAVRLDVQQALLYEPARRHLLPLFGGPGLPPAEGDRRLARLESLTGLARGDLREIVVARGLSRADWVVVLSGLFPRKVGVSALATALGSDGSPWTVAAGGVAAVRSDSGVASSRADDGALVLASSLGELERARARRGGPSALGLPAAGPGGFALGPAALHELGRSPAVLGQEELPGLLERLAGVRGSLTLGERIGLTVTLECTDRRVARKVGERALEMLRAFGQGGESPAELLGRTTAEHARVEDAAPGAAVQLTWEREEFDRLLELLAETIRGRYQ